MEVLLDTNLLLIYSRDSTIAKRIEEQYDIFNSNNNLYVSAITLGELNALAKKLNLGTARKENILKIINKMAKIRINLQELIDRYGDIDAYSQGKLVGKKGSFTARNMGKNDIWIAATASLFELKLFTTDKDFHHLDGEFLNLEFIDLERFKDH
ncbi:MAG: PIN domain-containing protein [Bacteroidota bacterium]